MKIRFWVLIVIFAVFGAGIGTAYATGKGTGGKQESQPQSQLSSQLQTLLAQNPELASQVQAFLAGTPSAGRRFSGPGVSGTPSAEATPVLGVTPSTEATAVPQGTAGPGMPGAFVGRGTSGTLQKVEGNTLTLSGSRGMVVVKVSPQTTVQKSVAGGLSDLKEGQLLNVTGEQQADGSVSASAITIMPQTR